MAYGCDLTRVFTYEGSEKDSLINYTTLAITLMTLVLCTGRAGKKASRYAGVAGWFWVPFTLVLFAMQVFADCSTNNVGISAVWSAYAGFIFLGWYRRDFGPPCSDDSSDPGTRASSPPVLLPIPVPYAVAASLAVWAGVCVYYAIVEEVITTVAHLVAFGVGMGALFLFEALHLLPGHPSCCDGRHGGGGGETAAGSTPYNELR
eukprot:g15682.t1